MAKRKNSLPSGNFRVLALDYTDDPDGKTSLSVSFTAPTTGRGADALRSEWTVSTGSADSDAEKISDRSVSLSSRYMDFESTGSSPRATLRGYAGSLADALRFCGELRQHIALMNMNQPAIVQIWVSDLSEKP